MLQPATDEQTVELLRNILVALADKGSPVLFPPDEVFKPSASAIRINTLWFASLSLALAVAVQVMLAKQWIHNYSQGLSSVPHLRSQLRQYRYDSLKVCRMLACTVES